MKPEIVPSTKAERHLAKQLAKERDNANVHKAALEHLRKIHDREKKKNVEYMRRMCQYRSKDGHVNVCDRDDGPVRCNQNTIEECPHYIFVMGGDV